MGREYVVFLVLLCICLSCIPLRGTPGFDWVAYVSMYPDELYPGVSGYVDVWLENTGDSELYIYGIWLQWEWQEEGTAWYSTADVYINPGEKKYLGSVDFAIPEYITPGIYERRVGVSQKHKEWYGWVDDGVVWAIWREVSILSPPSIAIVSCEFSRSTIYRGESVELVVKVKNTGGATANSVRVEVNSPSGLDLISVEPSYPVDIDGGSTRSFTITFRGTREGDYTVTVTTYSSNGGSGTATATIRVLEKAWGGYYGSEEPTSPILIILLAIAIILILMTILKRKRKKW